MRVAIPDSGGRVERVADNATLLVVIDLRDGRREHGFETLLTNRSMRDRASELAEMRVDVLLCNEISHAFQSLIMAYGIEVQPRCTGSVDEVIERFVHRYRWGEIPLDDQSPQLDALS